MFVLFFRMNAESWDIWSAFINGCLVNSCNRIDVLKSSQSVNKRWERQKEKSLENLIILKKHIFYKDKMVYPPRQSLNLSEANNARWLMKSNVDVDAEYLWFARNNFFLIYIAQRSISISFARIGCYWKMHTHMVMPACLSAYRTPNLIYHKVHEMCNSFLTQLMRT